MPKAAGDPTARAMWREAGQAMGAGRGKGALFGGREEGDQVAPLGRTERGRPARVAQPSGHVEAAQQEALRLRERARHAPDYSFRGVAGPELEPPALAVVIEPICLLPTTPSTP